MAQDTIDQAEIVAEMNSRPCQTEHLQIHGWTKQNIKDKSLEVVWATHYEMARTVEDVLAH